MKKITPQRLKNIALYYLERYDASSQKLRMVLKRRILKAKLEQPVPESANQWVEDIVLQMEHLGYLNDKRYSENTVRRLSEAGKSPSFIRTKLKLAGIDDDCINAVLDGTDELTQARLMVQKKHWGNDFNKDLARLARAGFSYETARQVLEEIVTGSPR